MKFTCPKCNTRYSVGEDKLPSAAALRFTCKKCGNVIRVKRKQEVSVPEAPSGDVTRVASLQEIAALEQASARALAESDEWFVLVRGKQHGPIARHELGDMLARGDISESTYVWCEGMAEWQRLGELKGLRDALSAGAALPAEGATRMMSVAQLEQLAQATRSEAPADAPGLDAATATMSAAQLEAERAKMRQLADGPAVINAEPSPVELTTPAKARSSEPAPAQVDLASAIDELAGKQAEKDALFGALIQEAVDEGAPLSPFVDEPDAAGDAGAELAGSREAYQAAPPGEATRVFMATAGIYRRRRNQKIAAVAAGVGVAVLAALIGLDVAGIWTLPGMGLVYDVTGLQDPNVERAVERVQAKLRSEDITPEEREALRRKLLGLTDEQPRAGKAAAKSSARATTAAAATQGVAEQGTLAGAERSLAYDVFADERKTDVGIQLTAPSEIQTPNLPDGLTQEAIYKVIADNNRSMKLCLEEAFKKGDKLTGRMEVELTIAATGEVVEARVASPQFRSTTIGSCTIRRAKGWRFPRFNGEPVTVVFPYVLSAGF